MEREEVIRKRNYKSKLMDSIELRVLALEVGKFIEVSIKLEDYNTLRSRMSYMKKKTGKTVSIRCKNNIATITRKK